MRRKTANQILLYLVKTAKPQRFVPSPDSDEIEGLDEPDEPLQDLLVQLSGVTSYTVRLSDFQAFLGEAYSFEKHIRKLHEAGHIHCPEIPEPGDVYDAPQYRKLFDASWGVEAAEDHDVAGPSFVFQFNTDDEDLSRVEPVLAYARARQHVERDPLHPAWKTVTREQLLSQLELSAAMLKSTEKMLSHYRDALDPVKLSAALSTELEKGERVLIDPLSFRLIVEEDFSDGPGEEAAEMLKVLEAVCTKLKRDAQDKLVEAP